MPASARTSETIAWCWPLETTTGVTAVLSRIARISGTSLIASGRVPTTTTTANRCSRTQRTMPRVRARGITRDG
jgi:hypothetical protein